MTLKYIESNLFDSIKDGDKVMHSCDLGTWNAGFAKQIKEKDPFLYECYKSSISQYKLGDYDVLFGGAFIAITLFASTGHLAHLCCALEKFRDEMCPVSVIKMSKELFTVPWGEMEAIIKDVFYESDITFEVFDL